MRQVISRDGTSIAYWTSGKGRPLVLVHGSLADHTRWDPLRPHLEPHATLYTMDRRGRGSSGDAPEYAVEREFEDVAAVVDQAAQYSGGPVDLFGHSFGAYCALQAGRLTPNVRRLVLYEPIVLAPESSTGFAEQAERLLAEGRRDEVVQMLFRDILKMNNGQIEAMRKDAAWQVRMAAAHTLPREDRVESALRFDPDEWRDFPSPTLLLSGELSPPELVESTMALAKALPKVRVATLEGQEHIAVTTAPGLVAQAVVPFLASSRKVKPDPRVS